VLIDFDFKIAIGRLQERCPVNLVKVHNLFRDSELSLQWDRGFLSSERFYETIQSELDLPLSLEEFKPFWNEIFAEKKEMIELARSLRGKRKIFVLSNTNPWHIDHLKERYGWLGEFDQVIASCDVRLMKPDPQIYRLALERAGVEPSETFYVDDIPAYVDSARALGIDAVLFKDYAGFLKEAARRGLA
jgi:putative hydrolase of the HAD superfamily